MASFDVVNYSLRPAKSIQQQLVFEGMRMLGQVVDPYPADLVFVGLSSIWFTDFVLAHKSLGIVDMVSIEANEIACARARFNRPFRTVRVEEGRSSEVLDRLFEDGTINERPWLVWLDYDGGMDEEVLGDVQSIVERAPARSVLLVTFNGDGRNYGPVRKGGEEIRRETLSDLFGETFPDTVDDEELTNKGTGKLLGKLTLDKMVEYARAAGRSGGFEPAFQLRYADGAPMVTVGGVLPTKADRKAVEGTVKDASWPCMLDEVIEAPPLTTLEALTLQAHHPRAEPLTRREVQGLGFDLKDEQLRTFARYYRQYPTFARLA